MTAGRDPEADGFSFEPAVFGFRATSVAFCSISRGNLWVGPAGVNRRGSGALAMARRGG